MYQEATKLEQQQRQKVALAAQNLQEQERREAAVRLPPVRAASANIKKALHSLLELPIFSWSFL